MIVLMLAALLLPARAEASVKVWLTVDAKNERGLSRLLAGGELKSGDQFQMKVKVDRPAYLYVVQFFPDGTSQVLFPEEGDIAIGAGEEMRLPPEGYWFKLDDTVGRENIYVIASERPLSQADKKTAAILDEVRKPKPKPAKAAPKKIEGLTMRTRGVLLVKESIDEPMQVQADRDGVAVVLFSFEHAGK